MCRSVRIRVSLPRLSYHVPVLAKSAKETTAKSKLTTSRATSAVGTLVSGFWSSAVLQDTYLVLLLSHVVSVMRISFLSFMVGAEQGVRLSRLCTVGTRRSMVARNIRPSSLLGECSVVRIDTGASYRRFHHISVIFCVVISCSHTAVPIHERNRLVCVCLDRLLFLCPRR